MASDLRYSGVVLASLALLFLLVPLADVTPWSRSARGPSEQAAYVWDAQTGPFSQGYFGSSVTGGTAFLLRGGAILLSLATLATAALAWNVARGSSQASSLLSGGALILATLGTVLLTMGIQQLKGAAVSIAAGFFLACLACVCLAGALAASLMRLGGATRPAGQPQS